MRSALSARVLAEHRNARCEDRTATDSIGPQRREQPETRGSDEKRAMLEERVGVLKPTVEYLHSGGGES